MVQVIEGADNEVTMNDFCSAFYGSVSLSLSYSSPSPVGPSLCSVYTVLGIVAGTSFFAIRVGFLRGKKVNKHFSLAYVYARNAHPAATDKIDTSRLPAILPNYRLGIYIYIYCVNTRV